MACAAGFRPCGVYRVVNFLVWFLNGRRRGESRYVDRRGGGGEGGVSHMVIHRDDRRG